MPWTPPPKERKKRIHPIWGGIGLILIPIYLIGSYYAAEYLVLQNRAQGWFYIPGEFTHLQQTLALAAAIGFFTFAVITIVWSLIRGPLGGPTDIHYSKMRSIKKRY
jgi:hypothetical protein